MVRFSLGRGVPEQVTELSVSDAVGTARFSFVFGRPSCNTSLNRTAFPLFSFPSGPMRSSRFFPYFCYDSRPGPYTLLIALKLLGGM